MHRSGHLGRSFNEIHQYIYQHVIRLEDLTKRRRDKLSKIYDMRLLALAMHDRVGFNELTDGIVADLESDLGYNVAKKPEEEVEWVHPTTIEEMQAELAKAEAALVNLPDDPRA